MEVLFNKLKQNTVKKVIVASLFGLGLIMDLLTMGGSVSNTDASVWKTAGIWAGANNYQSLICLVFVLLACVNITAAVVGGACALRGRKKYVWLFAVMGCAHLAKLLLNGVFDVLSDSNFSMLAGLAFALIGFVYLTFLGGLSTDDDGKQFTGLVDARFLGLTAVGWSSFFVTLSLFFVPFCAYLASAERRELVPIGALESGQDNIICLILFVILTVLNSVAFFLLTRCLRIRNQSGDAYADGIGKVILLSAFSAGGYFLASVVYCSITNSGGGNSTASSFVPCLLTVILSVCYAFLARSFATTSCAKKVTAAKVELFVYALLMALVTVAASLSDIIFVEFSLSIPDLHLNGWQIFMRYNSMGSGFQVVAFLLFAILAITIGLSVLLLVSLISKSKFFGKIALAQIVSSAVFCMMIGLFGKYYEIVQKLNEDALISLFKQFVDISAAKFRYRVTGTSFYWFIAAMAIVVVVLIRRPYSRSGMDEIPLVVNSAGETGLGDRQNWTPEENRTSVKRENTVADPCPAFTQLDSKLGEFQAENHQARNSAFENPTLQELVRFVVAYARESRLRLSYTVEDIATFVAGLGATRLSILQGMSGTGKTSLPKIFSEAIMGNCDIIEVESSWRDKNELLGYYNEFSRMYTPKKFTQALYRARLNPEAVTFIVLDEMNLSRVEYYFSDFLSLMEHEEDEREVKLLNVALCRTEDGKEIPYKGLSEGHTLKIPNNIWFVGTANRDESTFEISDKVYDRAHTMNFNKRAPKVIAYGQEMVPRYFSAEVFLDLLEKAKATNVLDVENCSLIQDVERLLAPHNISFGNRIAKQIENFVSIYCACLPTSEGVLNDAIETILLSKVVSKLEFKSVENKMQLAAEFEKLKLHRCSQFILRLNED